MEDKDYLAALRRAFDDGRLRVELDHAKLDHVDSPILVQSEKAWWIYGGMAGGLTAGLAIGWQYGVGFAVAVAVLYLSVGRRIINRRMDRRLRAQAMEDILQWRKLWRLKGVRLTVGTARCESPADNWIRFAMTNLSETGASDEAGPVPGDATAAGRL